MLKSDHVVVGSAGDVIVWRFKKANPYDILFLSLQHGSCFFTKRMGAVLCHSISAPHGAMDVADQVVAATRAVDLIADLSKEGVIVSSDRCAMPNWADEGVLLEAVTPASQQAIFAAPDQTLTTLEF